MAAEPVQWNGKAAPFRCGFSASLLGGLNENDAKASMRVWIQMLGKERHIPMDPDVQLFDGVGGLRRALLDKKVDGVVLGIDEYWAARKLLSSRHYVANVTGGDIYEHYLVLVHKGAGITNLDTLRGRTLNRFDNSETRLAVPWLDTILMQKGLSPSENFFGRIKVFHKLTKVLLPVFFRRTDACLVTRKGFDVMVELNPQVGEQLQVLAASPKLISSGFFIRAAYPPKLEDNFVASVEAIDTSVAGRQVLTVFHTDRLVARPFSCLNGSLQLLTAYHRLLGERTATQLSQAPASADKKGGP